MDGNSIGTVQSIDGGNAVVVSGGKLYNVPLSALYAHGTDTAKGLVSKVPQAQLEAHTARSEEHTSELQSLMRISYAVFCLKKKKQIQNHKENNKKQESKKTSTCKDDHRHN